MTTYTKPKDVSYTDMCIYIDDNIYKEQYDESLVYEYLYHIMVMLARNKYYFKTQAEYDYFGVFAATRLYSRLTDPKQFDESSKLQKIKSILNFAKATLYPLKVDFQKEHFFQEVKAKDDYSVLYNFQERVSESLYDLDKVEFQAYLYDIDKTIREHIKKIPYRGNKTLWTNIYTSCLLTILNRITLDNYSRKYLRGLKKDNLQTYKSTKRLLDRQKIDSVILFDIPDDFRDYVFVLVNEVFHIISKDLSDCINIEMPSSTTLKNILLSQTNEEYDE